MLAESLDNVDVLIKANLSFGSLLNNLFVSVGFGSGTKNSAADRSGMPISQSVGPFLGGAKLRRPKLMLLPVFEDPIKLLIKQKN